jgi:hypothetical protein
VKSLIFFNFGDKMVKNKFRKDAEKDIRPVKWKPKPMK